MSDQSQLPPDDLLGSLGALAREQDAEHPRAWEEVVAGQRSVADVRAERADVDGKNAELYAELFAPVAEDERERLTDLLADALASDTKPESSSKPISLAAEREKRSRRRGWVAGLTTLATAAGLAFWLLPGSPGSSGEGVNLPSYELTVRNRTVEAKRSADTKSQGPNRYHPDSELNWALNPQTTHEYAVKLAVLLTPVGGGEAQLRKLERVQVQQSGAIQVRGSVQELLGLDDGVWDVQLLVGPADLLPQTLEQAQRLVADKPAGIEVVAPYRLEVVAR